MKNHGPGSHNTWGQEKGCQGAQGGVGPGRSRGQWPLAMANGVVAGQAMTDVHWQWPPVEQHFLPLFLGCSCGQWGGPLRQKLQALDARAGHRAIRNNGIGELIG